MNQIFVKFVIDGNSTKTISSRPSNIRDVKRFLKIQNATQRKSYCLNGVNLDIASNTRQ